VITLAGLVRFWIGAVATFAISLALAWIAGRPLWGLAIGGGAFLLCLLLLWNRSWNGPYILDLVVAAGLIAGVVLLLLHPPGAHLRVWLWTLLGLYFLAFLLVFSLGDYPD
jgi:hypothetical protein